MRVSQTALARPGEPAVLSAEKAWLVLTQRVCVPLRVGSSHQGEGDVVVPLVDLGDILPERCHPKVDVKFEQLDR